MTAWRLLGQTTRLSSGSANRWRVALWELRARRRGDGERGAPRGETEARAATAKAWLVVDSVENMDGLERLVVICVGLDQVIDRGDGVRRLARVCTAR